MSESFILKIRNFQRIKKADFEFEPGLNVIIGTTNQGKSSTGRAIATCIFNSGKDSQVRIGATRADIGIRYNGHSVVWTRDLSAASKNSYKIDKKLYQKLGKGQPEEVAEALGIREVEIDDSKVRLNFQKQMSYPFLMDRTPSQVFKFMAQSAEEDNLMEVIDTMKTDYNSIAVQIKQDESALDALKVAYNTELGKYRKLLSKKDVAEKVIEMDSEVKEFLKREGLILTIEENSETLEDSESKLRVIEVVLDNTSEEVDKLEVRVSHLGSLKEIASEGHEWLKELNKANFGLKSLEKDKEILDTLCGEERFGRIDKIYAMYSQALEYNTEVMSLGDLVLEYSDRISGLDRIEEKVSEYLVEIKGKQDRLKRLSELMAEAKTNKGDLDKLTGQLRLNKSMISEVEEELAEFDICPYCGSEIRKESK